MEEKESKNKFQLVALWLIVASWLLRGLITGMFFGNREFLFLVLLLLYKLIGKLNPTEVLKIWGIKRAKITTLLLYVSGTILMAYVFASWILPKIMNVDVNKLAQLPNYYSMTEEISKKYNKLIGIIGSMSYYVYQTFFEEFIFRGLIMRKLLLNSTLSLQKYES